VDERRARSGVAGDEGGRIARARDHPREVALPQPHRLLPDHVHRRDEVKSIVALCHVNVLI
jgi:hypothetical protein